MNDIPGPGLSPQMNKVIRLLSMGKRHAQIAREMGISVHTVRSYLRQAYERMGVHNAAAAAAELARLGRESAGGVT